VVDHPSPAGCQAAPRPHPGEASTHPLRPAEGVAARRRPAEALCRALAVAVAVAVRRALAELLFQPSAGVRRWPFLLDGPRSCPHSLERRGTRAPQ
jgi:hypothetical protein